jgi:hypothetical protein
MILSAVLGSEQLPDWAVDDLELESLIWEAGLVANSRGDVPRMGRYQSPSERIIPWPVIRPCETGEDQGDIDAWVEGINAELAKPNVLVITSTTGTSATFLTFPSRPLPPRTDMRYRFAGIYWATAEITVEPYALGATATITSADLETPGSVDLSAMTGTYPAPLTVSVDPGATTAAEMHSVYLALCPDAAWTGYLVEATAVTGWEDEVADAGLGVNVVRFASGAGDDAGTVDVSAFPASAYLVLARVKVDAGGTLTASTEFTDDVTCVETHWEWLPLGEVALPTKRVRGSATCSLTLTGSAATAAGYCHRLCFLPLRWGFVSYHHLTSASDSISALRAEWEDVYVEDVVDFEHILGGGLKCKGGQLIVLTEEATGDALHHHADVAVSYRPRRNWLG